MAAVDTTSLNGDIKFTIGVDVSADDAFETDNLQEEVMRLHCARAIRLIFVHASFQTASRRGMFMFLDPTCHFCGCAVVVYGRQCIIVCDVLCRES